jgi:hypothetical protein
MNATALMLRQHRKIEHRIESLRRDGHARSRCLAQLVDDMTTHFALEASLLYPIARATLGTGVGALRAQHTSCKELVLALAASPPPGRAFLAKVDELAASFHGHATAVEADILPALAQALSEGELYELGEDMERMAIALAAKGRPDLGALRMAMGNLAFRPT